MRNLSTKYWPAFLLALFLTHCPVDDPPVTPVYGECVTEWNSGITTGLSATQTIDCSDICGLSPETNGCSNYGLLTGLRASRNEASGAVTGLTAVCSRYRDGRQITTDFEAFEIYPDFGAESTASPWIDGARDIVPIAIHYEVGGTNAYIENFMMGYATNEGGTLERFNRTNWFGTSDDTVRGRILNCVPSRQVIRGLELQFDTENQELRRFEILTSDAP